MCKQELTVPAFLISWGLALLLGFSAFPTSTFAANGFTLQAIDEKSGSPVPTRVVFQHADGRQRIVRRTLPAGIGFVINGEQMLSLSLGDYQFQMIRGPEYRILTGTFTIDRDASDSHSVALPRMVDMAAEGWWSGDPAVTPSLRTLPLLMQSEDLHFAGYVGTGEQVFVPLDQPLPENGDASLWGPSEIRTDMCANGNGLLLVGIPEAFPIDSSTAPPTVSSSTIRAAAQYDVEGVIVENPFAWDLPIWLASGRVDAIFLQGDWLRLDRSVKRVINGRPPNDPGFSGTLGVGKWAEHIYWQLLNCGLRMAPLGGSGSQLTKHPVGYSRTYVHSPASLDTSPAGTPITSEDWWAGALAGRSTVTNGPLLRPRFGGELPGHVFQARTGEALEFQMELNLATRDPVDYLEVIHNGTIVYNARLDEFAKAGGMIPKLRIEESGWVLVRVVTAHTDHWRAAVSAPWYIEFDGKPRIERAAVQFFQDWLSEREATLGKLPANERAAHAPYIRAAREYWQSLADQAAP